MTCYNYFLFCSSTRIDLTTLIEADLYPFFRTHKKQNKFKKFASSNRNKMTQKPKPPDVSDVIIKMISQRNQRSGMRVDRFIITLFRCRRTLRVNSVTLELTSGESLSFYMEAILLTLFL